MKIMVYGCGVIGSFLVHKLCEAGNDVTVAARGKWKDVLQNNGLQVRHKLSGKVTLDHPKVVETVPENKPYDIVFSVMQGQQQEQLIPELAKINTPLVVLVGNNLYAAQMEKDLLSLSENKKKVLFGFQGTAGVRHADSVTCISLGSGSMTVGGLHQVPDIDSKIALSSAFGDTGYQLEWMDDMEGWLYCHAAFILPIVYLSYRLNCDLTKASREDIADVLSAAEEGYKLIDHAGMQIRPKGDEMFFNNDAKKSAVKLFLYIIAKTSLGRLCATDHCRNAVSEMEWIDEQFEQLKQKNPDYRMMVWDELRRRMGDWAVIHQTYDRERGTFALEKPEDNTLLSKEIAAGAALGTCALLTVGVAASKKASKNGSRLGKVVSGILFAGGVGVGIYSAYRAARKFFGTR